VPPFGAFGGHDGFEPPLLEPLPVPLLEPLPPELLPELPPDPLDPLAPELLPEPPLELPPELPELELLPPSAPPSEGPVNVVPPHAHIAAAPATIQSFVRMSRTSQLSSTQVRYQEESEQFRRDHSRPCAVPRTRPSWSELRGGLLPVRLIR
jgi:hypothetical protein